MEVSKKTLIITLIVNILLIAVCVVCMIVTNFNKVVLWLSAGVITLVLVSSVLIWVYGKEYRKNK